MKNPFASGTNKTLKIWLAVIGLVIVTGVGALIFTGSTSLYKGALIPEDSPLLVLREVCDAQSCQDPTAISKSISGQASFHFNPPDILNCEADSAYTGPKYIVDFFVDQKEIPAQSAGGICFGGLLLFEAKLNTAPLANGSHGFAIRYTHPNNQGDHKAIKSVTIDVQNAPPAAAVSAPVTPPAAPTGGPASERGAIFNGIITKINSGDECKDLAKYACEAKSPTTCTWITEKDRLNLNRFPTPSGVNLSSTVPAHCEPSVRLNVTIITPSSGSSSQAPAPAPAPAPVPLPVPAPAPIPAPAQGTTFAPAPAPIAPPARSVMTQLLVTTDTTFNEFNTPQLSPKTDNQQVASFFLKNMQDDPTENVTSIEITTFTIVAPILTGNTREIPYKEINFKLQANGQEIADLPEPTVTSTTVMWTAASGKKLFEVPAEDAVTIGVFATTGATEGTFGFMIPQGGVHTSIASVTVKGTFPVPGGNYTIARAPAETEVPAQAATSSMVSALSPLARLPSAPSVGTTGTTSDDNCVTNRVGARGYSVSSNCTPRARTHVTPPVVTPPSLVDVQSESTTLLADATTKDKAIQDASTPLNTSLSDAQTQAGSLTTTVQEVKDALAAAQDALAQVQAATSAAQLKTAQDLNTAIQSATPFESEELPPTEQTTKDIDNLKVATAAINDIYNVLKKTVHDADLAIQNLNTKVAGAKAALASTTPTLAAPAPLTTTTSDQSAAQIAALNAQIAALNQQLITLQQQNAAQSQQAQLQQQITALQSALATKFAAAGTSTITFIAPTPPPSPTTNSTTAPLVGYTPPPTAPTASSIITPPETQTAAAATGVTPPSNTAVRTSSAAAPTTTSAARAKTSTQPRLVSKADSAAAAAAATPHYSITSVSNESAAETRRATRALHGAAIQGSSGPEVLVYPLLVASVNGLYYAVRRRRKNAK